jgi:hypothetical protein
MTVSGTLPVSGDIDNAVKEAVADEGALAEVESDAGKQRFKGNNMVLAPPPPQPVNHVDVTLHMQPTPFHRSSREGFVGLYLSIVVFALFLLLIGYYFLSSGEFRG